MTRTKTAIAVLLASLALPGIAAAQNFDDAGERQMLARINAMRASQQLAPLTRNDNLDAVARAHSSEMSQTRALSHVSARTGTPADRVRATGLSATTVAENVALHRTADAAHEALIASEAHRSNMLSPDITHVGLAALRSEQGVYVTQVFAALAPTPPPQRAEPPAREAPAPPPEESFPLPNPSIEELPFQILEQLLPEQTIEQPGRVEQAPIAPQEVAPVQPAPQRAMPARPLEMQPGSNGTVLLQRAVDGSRIEAYWVFGSGRWWFYPLPEHPIPGQRLVPDLSVSGPPPGYPAQPFGPQHFGHQAPAPQAFRVAPLPPPVQAAPQQGQALFTIQPGNTAFFSVPPPPLVGNPDRAWRRAHRSWQRAYQRWLRDQRRARAL
jgi:hypothetical protein